MNWYLDVWRKFAVFHGRSRRKEYWYFVLCNVIAEIVLAIVDGATGMLHEATGIGLLSGLYMFAVLIPSVAVSIRRLHDTGRSGWWLLLGIIPLLGLVILYFAVQDSQPGDNQYGPNPKGVAGPGAVAAAPTA